jgi:quinoprotein glucose dehydrogenase
VHRGGREIPAVVVTTKIGHLFLLDRETGKPLLPVSERPVPQTDVPGEKTSPTQPFPKYDALVPQGLTEKDAWGLTPADLQYCRARIRQWPARMFTPPRVGWTLQFPGNIGGVAWGGGAWDPSSGLYIVATNRIAFQVRLIPRAQFAQERTQGIHNRITGEFAPQAGAPYGLYRQPFFSPHGLPCNAPPWGTIEAMDLATGKLRWTAPLGQTTVANDRVIPGAINLGGPLVTAGGLVFISATRFDDRLHVYDAATGKDLWESPLPAGAQSTPMTYQLDPHGKQYVVICAGGHGKLGTHMGDAVIAYTLPE